MSCSYCLDTLRFLKADQIQVHADSKCMPSRFHSRCHQNVLHKDWDTHTCDEFKEDLKLDVPDQDRRTVDMHMPKVVSDTKTHEHLSFSNGAWFLKKRLGFAGVSWIMKCVLKKHGKHPAVEMTVEYESEFAGDWPVWPEGFRMEMGFRKVSKEGKEEKDSRLILAIRHFGTSEKECTLSKSLLATQIPDGSHPYCELRMKDVEVTS